MTVPSAKISYSGQPLSSVNNPTIVSLKSGAIYTLPQGNFLVRIGAQSALQWYDQFSASWHILEAGYCNMPIPVASDGTNFRVINLSGTIMGANITNAGSGYAQASTTVSFAAPSSGITATGTPIIGGKLTMAVTAGGTGYTNPTLFVQDPQLCGGTTGLCLPAKASATISAGVITAVTVDFAGAGYVTAPTVTISDPAGSGATITATVAGSGTLTGIVMTNPGSGYTGTAIPAVTITGAGSAAAATALPNLALTSVTVGGTNTGYTASIVGLTSLGTINSINGEPALPRSGRFIAAQSGGALGTPTIEDAGSGFQTVPLAKQVGNATADGSVNATFVAVVGGVTNTLMFWQVG